MRWHKTFSHLQTVNVKEYLHGNGVMIFGYKMLKRSL